MLLEALSSPYTYSTILFIIAGLSFPIHLFGGYCILVKTPEVMKSVKWSLFNVHMWTSFLDLSMSFFAQPFISAPFTGFPMGVLHRIGVETDLLCYVCSVISYLMPVSIIGMFENRFFILFAHKTFWRFARHPFRLIDYLLAILIPLPVYLGTPEQEYARNVTFEQNPGLMLYNIPESPMFVVAIEKTWIRIRHLMLFSKFLIQLLVFVVLIRWNMNKSISEIKSMVSKNTFRMHKSFVRSLNFQVAIPLFIVCIPFMVNVFIPMFSTDLQGTTNLICIIIISMHGVLSTLVMVHLQKAYHVEILRIFGCKTAKIEKNVGGVVATL